MRLPSIFIWCCKWHDWQYFYQPFPFDLDALKKLMNSGVWLTLKKFFWHSSFHSTKPTTTQTIVSTPEPHNIVLQMIPRPRWRRCCPSYVIVYMDSLIYKPLSMVYTRDREYILYVLIFADQWHRVRPSVDGWLEDGATTYHFCLLLLLHPLCLPWWMVEPVLYGRKFNFQLQHTWQGRSRKWGFVLFVIGRAKYL